MDRNMLLESARALTQPPLAAAEEFAAQRDSFAEEITGVMKARPDLAMLIGEGNTAMMEDNHRNHVRFMESVFRSYHAQVLVETVLWVFRAYRSHGFRLAYWPALLDNCVEILKKRLTSGAFEALYPFYHWLIVNQAAFAALSDQFVTSKEQ
ncbi:MAG: hypothetical protein RDV48_14520 [Candidatus Eremiobacteraeota bacterium]|nr:hypothetical protein [Candidatus Eremiobacteraeota bacterium]